MNGIRQAKTTFSLGTKNATQSCLPDIIMYV